MFTLFKNQNPVFILFEILSFTLKELIHMYLHRISENPLKHF